MSSAALSPVRPAPDRLFYPLATLLLLALTLTGFHHFYFEGRAYPGRELAPPIRVLVVTHGVAMSLWMLLALAQPLLVAAGNRRLHMRLGVAGALLAAALVWIGLQLAVASARVAPPGTMFGPMTPRQFLAVPVGSILLFGGFVTAGILWRRRPEAHRPMMLLATLAAVGAGISRIDALNHLYAGTVWQRVFGVFFFTVVTGAVLVAGRALLTRALDRWLAGGFLALALGLALTAQLAMTPAWGWVAGRLVP